MHRHQLHAACVILLKYLLAVSNKALAYSSSWIKKRRLLLSHLLTVLDRLSRDEQRQSSSKLTRSASFYSSNYWQSV